MATKTNSKRDFRKEYQTRIARGLANGKSRAQARGHARAKDLGENAGRASVNRKSPLEIALRLMKDGQSQKQAAKEAGVSAERLRRYLEQNTSSRRDGRRWIIVDERPVPIFMITRGSRKEVTVARELAHDASLHLTAVNLFIETNSISHLEPFVGKGLRDTKGHLHPFETRPNVLRKLDSAGELDFPEMYRPTAQW